MRALHNLCLLPRHFIHFYRTRTRKLHWHILENVCWTFYTFRPADLLITIIGLKATLPKQHSKTPTPKVSAFRMSKGVENHILCQGQSKLDSEKMAMLELINVPKFITDFPDTIIIIPIIMLIFRTCHEK